MMHMKRAEATVIIGALLTGWVLLLVFAYSMFWPVNPMVIHNYSDDMPVPVVTKVLLPGETLQYELDYCKNTDIRPVVHRTLIDGQIITLADTSGGLPRGCRKTTIANVVIPPTINPGEYYLDVTLDYQINFFRVERVHYRTEYFTVGVLPAADQEVQIIEREGQTIIVPVPVQNPNEELQIPVVNVETRIEQREERDEAPASPQPTPEPERPGVLDGVRDFIGL